MGEIWETDGDFVICKNCLRAFNASPWADSQDMKHVRIVTEKKSSGGGCPFVEIEAECPQCYHKDNYVGGDDNKWLEIHGVGDSGPKKQEMVHATQEAALRKRLLQLQRHNLELQEQNEKLRIRVKAAEKDNKRLSDLAYAKFPEQDRRDLQ